MKAVFKYPGSKWSIAEWIVGHFPENYRKMVYVEPFAGSCAVFFNKEPSGCEVINDLDGDIVNFFRVLREIPEELKRAVELTPFSRAEYDLAFESCDDPLERARRFLVIANQGIGSKRATKSGWQCYLSPNPGGCPVKWSSIIDVIPQAAARLRGTTTNLVHIENKDAFEIIEKANRPDVLIYADPPYVRKARKSGALYKNEMVDEQHVRLLMLLKASKAKVILSGYENNIYDRELQGWRKDTVPVRNTVGTAIETIWMNYDAPVQQQMMAQWE